MAGRATPATRAADRAGARFVLHEYAHDPAAPSYGLEAAGALGVDPERVFKTLVVLVRDRLTVCVVPAAGTLDLRALGKGAAMAPPEQAERATGYVTGAISPIGQRTRLPTLLDDTALGFETVYVSAGRRGLQMELAPADLRALTEAQVRTLRRAP